MLWEKFLKNNWPTMLIWSNGKKEKHSKSLIFWPFIHYYSILTPSLLNLNKKLSISIPVLVKTSTANIYNTNTLKNCTKCSGIWFRFLTFKANNNFYLKSMSGPNKEVGTILNGTNSVNHQNPDLQLQQQEHDLFQHIQGQSLVFQK